MVVVFFSEVITPGGCSRVWVLAGVSGVLSARRLLRKGALPCWLGAGYFFLFLIFSFHFVSFCFVLLCNNSVDLFLRSCSHHTPVEASAGFQAQRRPLLFVQHSLEDLVDSPGGR